MAVTDEAILKIKGMILAGELAPGDRLPPEKELSEHLHDGDPILEMSTVRRILEPAPASIAAHPLDAGASPDCARNQPQSMRHLAPSRQPEPESGGESPSKARPREPTAIVDALERGDSRLARGGA